MVVLKRRGDASAYVVGGAARLDVGARWAKALRRRLCCGDSVPEPEKGKRGVSVAGQREGRGGPGKARVAQKG